MLTLKVTVFLKEHLQEETEWFYQVSKPIKRRTDRKSVLWAAEFSQARRSSGGAQSNHERK